MTWVGFLLTLAIAARMTRLIVVDVIAQPLRSWVTGLRGPESRLAVLVHCSWCTGFWVSVAASFGTHWLADRWWWQCFAVACGVSWLYAILAAWLDDE